MRQQRAELLSHSGVPPSNKRKQTGENHMRSGCLWLIGVPIPIIILLWLITGHA